MPHFLNRKESQLRSSDHIKKIAFPTAHGSYVAVLSVWELGLLSAKKIEYPSATYFGSLPLSTV